ncbi:hypothetical protein GCM10009804_05160 [Kribbella hippodromi]|uniref:Uncharacterized protein n=1 Tax=Kribbella hippodromi TaxID=434347 RepID=A0ABN2C275_9ACTN
MEDTREVSAELHRLAESEPLQPVDSAQALARGRRGRRRRTFIGAGGAVAGVAAVALAVTVLPNLTSAGRQPSVAGQSQAQNSDFSAVPGVPRGEAGADQRVSYDEAQRRCSLRNPDEKRPLEKHAGTYRTGRMAMYKVANGERFNRCIVPGGDKPSAELVAAAAKDPVPTSVAGKLRNCSVLSWVDLTKWQVVASDQSKDRGTGVVVAVSPSGTKVVDCDLSANKRPLAELDRTTAFTTLTKLGGDDPTLEPAAKAKRANMYAGAGGSGACTAGVCKGYGMTAWGRVASTTATTVQVHLGKARPYVVPVGQGGWFALVYRTTASHKQGTYPKIQAYDKNGKVVQTFS